MIENKGRKTNYFLLCSLIGISLGFLSTIFIKNGFFTFLFIGAGIGTLLDSINFEVRSIKRKVINNLLKLIMVVIGLIFITDGIIYYINPSFFQPRELLMIGFIFILYIFLDFIDFQLVIKNGKR